MPLVQIAGAMEAAAGGAASLLPGERYALTWQQCAMGERKPCSCECNSRKKGCSPEGTHAQKFLKCVLHFLTKDKERTRSCSDTDSKSMA